MSNQAKPVSHRPWVRRLWKPAAATGAGSTAVAIWFEEILLYAQEILALIFLPIMASLVYVLNHLVFKSRTPRPEDLSTPNKGEGK